MAALDVVVRFLGDTGKLQSDLKDVEGATGKVGTGLKNLARTAAGAFSGIAVARFAQDSIQAASDMAESQSKLAAVFGAATADIRKSLGGIVADTLGSTKLAVDAAGSFGNMFTQMGLAGDQAVGFSKGMLTLTADLVSFHNADPTAVVEAIGSAFRGEYDSVQKWIPTINAAAVEQRALTDTGKESADQLTAGEKAAATYALMMEGAGKATGDAARTADSAANRQRALSRQFQDISIKVGQALLPVLEELMPIVADVAKWFQDADKSVTLATIAFAAFAAIAITIGGVVGGIVAAVAAVIAVAYLLWENWDTVWNWIKDHPAIALLITILAAPIAMFVMIIGALKTLYENWDEIWNAIATAAEDAWNWIETAANDTIAFLESIPGMIGDAFSSVFDFITQPFRDAWHELERIGGSILDAIGAPVRGAANIWNRLARFLNGIEIPIPEVDLGPLGSIGGGSISFPHVPTIELARGGIVTRDTIARIGERGPEAVVPLDRAGGFGNVFLTVNVTTTGLGADAPEIQRAVVEAVRGYVDRNGRLVGVAGP